MQPAASSGEDIRAASETLAAALRGGSRIAALPGAAPRTLDEAYAVQEALVASLGPVGGWKVAPLVPGGEPRCSPIPASMVHDSSATLDPAVLGGSRAELEVAIRLGRDLTPGGRTLSADEVAAAIASVHPAIELLGSRFEGAAPDLHRFADLANSGGVLVGPAASAWRGIEFADLALELQIEGKIHRPAGPQPTTERTLAAIGWLAVHAEKRGRPLGAGHVIITGARVGPVPFGPSLEAVGVAGALGSVRVAATRSA